MAETLHVVCPACGGVNRLPTARLEAGPRCGRCHGPLFRGEPVALSEADFDTHVGRSDIPVIVDFWASWCGPCKMMAPAFAQAAEELEPHYRLAKVNTEEAQGLAGRFGIRSIPTLIAFQRGRELGRQSGALSKADILRWASGLGRAA
ncbi:thioredoxin TrxC [Arhodomonas sp. SL1]|uniref:thioredoxin TrxC n=1 Tax=Arhodomonas sp. SL1 TaxID=3425691 RepID=UPI003F884D51